MRKTRVLFIIAMAFFAGATVCFMQYEVRKIFSMVKGEAYFSPYYPSYFDIAVFAGAGLLIVGVLLARAGKARCIYPMGFLLLIIPNAVSILPHIGFYNSAHVPWIILVIIALGLLAADALILPRVKVLGIIGAAILCGVMLGYAFMAVRNGFLLYFHHHEMFGAAEKARMWQNIYYHSFYVEVAAGGLLYVIGRQPRRAH